MKLHLKRRRRVEIQIDQRMLSFLKPTAIICGSSLSRRRRDTLEFLNPFTDRGKPQDPASDLAS